MSLFLPFIFGFSDATPGRDSDDPDHETAHTEGSQRQRIILVNPLTQGMVVIDGGLSLEALFRELANGKGGRPPASKESIEALPSVEIGEDNEDLECVVCLGYEMPVEEIDWGKKREEEVGERRSGGGGEVWVSFPFNRSSRRGQDLDQAQAVASDSNDDDSSSTHGGAAEES
ncbi:hypothetical protein JHK86_000477 [Glycine max]|nr:hypothetical protein JHK86_000477 [Glycine max]